MDVARAQGPAHASGSSTHALALMHNVEAATSFLLCGPSAAGPSESLLQTAGTSGRHCDLQVNTTGALAGRPSQHGSARAAPLATTVDTVLAMCLLAQAKLPPSRHAHGVCVALGSAVGNAAPATSGGALAPAPLQRQPSSSAAAAAPRQPPQLSTEQLRSLLYAVSVSACSSQAAPPLPPAAVKALAGAAGAAPGVPGLGRAASAGPVAQATKGSRGHASKRLRTEPRQDADGGNGKAAGAVSVAPRPSAAGAGAGAGAALAQPPSTPPSTATTTPRPPVLSMITPAARMYAAAIQALASRVVRLLVGGSSGNGGDGPGQGGAQGSTSTALTTITATQLGLGGGSGASAWLSPAMALLPMVPMVPPVGRGKGKGGAGAGAGAGAASASSSASTTSMAVVPAQHHPQTLFTPSLPSASALAEASSFLCTMARLLADAGAVLAPSAGLSRGPVPVLPAQGGVQGAGLKAWGEVITTRPRALQASDLLACLGSLALPGQAGTAGSGKREGQSGVGADAGAASSSAAAAALTAPSSPSPSLPDLLRVVARVAQAVLVQQAQAQQKQDVAESAVSAAGGAGAGAGASNEEEEAEDRTAAASSSSSSPSSLALLDGAEALLEAGQQLQRLLERAQVAAKALLQ